jgi:hypothetical protein
MSRGMQPKIGDEPRLEAGATKGLDWRADYHIIINSFKAAAAGSGAAGKAWRAGKAPRRIFQKKH